MNPTKVFFFGMSTSTLKLLINDQEVTISGIAKIKRLRSEVTKNPFNQVFKYVYFSNLDKGKANRFLKILFYLGFYFYTGPFKQFREMLKLILKHKIPCFYANKKNLNAFSTFINKNKVELFVVDNWWMLPSEILSIPKLGVINIHPSLLPKYRGALPTLWALKNGDNQSGVSLMLLKEMMDTGNILTQYQFSILPQDNSISIEKKIEDCVQKNLVNSIKTLKESNIITTPQEEDKASYTDSFFSYQEIKLSSESAKDIYNKVLMYPYLWHSDRAYIQLKDKKVFIKGCIFQKENIKNNFSCFPSIYLRTIEGHIKIRAFKDISLLDYFQLKKIV